MPRTQTENLTNNNHKQFYVLLNTNQIKLYTYPDLLKENPLLRKFLNSNQQLTLDEAFYHTYILLFATIISAAIVIKATKYSMHFIIHNSYDVPAKYSIISTKKNVKLSYLVGSVDKNNVYFHMTYLLPKY